MPVLLCYVICCLKVFIVLEQYMQIENDFLKTLQVGSYRFATIPKDNLTAVWWKDRRDVYLMSTLHRKAVQTVMNRQKGAKDKTQMPCPAMIVDYNQNMGGVDLTDQHLSNYALGTRKTQKSGGKRCFGNLW